MSRTKMPNRRTGYTFPLEFEGMRTFITININEDLTFREVFCADMQIGSSMHSMLTHICILISIYLQTGGEIEMLVTTFKRTLPSIVSAIAEAILLQQRELNGEINGEDPGISGST